MDDAQQNQADLFATVGRSAAVDAELSELGYRQISSPHGQASVWVRSDDLRIGTYIADQKCAAFFGITTDKCPSDVAALAVDGLLVNLRDNAFALVGHFAAFIAERDTLSVLMDHLGSVSVYTALTDEDMSVRVLGTNLRDVASAADRLAVDPVSAFEFVQSGVITYPHTIHSQVMRLAPGVIADFDATGPSDSYSQSHYWQPPKVDEDLDLVKAAKSLSKMMQRNLQGLAAHHHRIVLLMSGGEDSRVLAEHLVRFGSAGGLLSAVIFLDERNREWHLANAAARRIMIPLTARFRKEDHQTRMISKGVRLTGGGIDLLHAHSVDLIDRDEADLFVDGWSADSFYKDHTSNTRTTKFHGFQVKLDRVAEPSTSLGPAWWQDLTIGRSVLARRNSKMNVVARFREPVDAAAWMSLWPISDHAEYSMFATNWKLRPSVSPYMFGNVVHLAATVSLHHKINRRLFHQAFTSSLGSAGWIPRTGGQIPRLGARANLLAANLVKLGFRIWDLTQSMRGAKAAQGPWQSFAARRAAILAAASAAPPSWIDEADRLGRGLGDHADAPETHMGSRWSTDQTYRVLQLAELLAQSEPA